jgi:hypothetical protein
MSPSTPSCNIAKLTLFGHRSEGEACSIYGREGRVSVLIIRQCKDKKESFERQFSFERLT